MRTQLGKSMDINLGEAELTYNTNILEIEVPKEMETNAPTGISKLDRMFAGDGVTPSSVILVTGSPGAGKTTLMIQLADSLTKQNHIVLYNTGEESLYQIRRVVNRLELTNGFTVGHHRKVEELIEHVKLLQTANPTKQVFLIQDSLQTLELTRQEGQRGRPVSGTRAQLDSLEAITTWAKTTYGVALIVGQVNKKGDFAGKNEIKHVVDCHMHLGYVLDMNTGDEIACAEMQKNRFGVGGIYHYFKLTETGVEFLSNGNCPV
jgi:DNA repair protein RadA/Sms